MAVVDWYCDGERCEVSITAPIVLTFLRPFLSQLDFNRWAWYTENGALRKAAAFRVPESIVTLIEQCDDREVSISLNPRWNDTEDWYPEFEDEGEFFERLGTVEGRG